MSQSTKISRISGAIGILGIACIATGFGAFFGWPGAIIGSGATLWVISLGIDKIVADDKRNEARANSTRKETP